MTPLAEDEALQRIRDILGSRIGGSGLEDDAAVVPVPGGGSGSGLGSGSGSGSLVLSVDSVVEGVHVDLSWCSPADVGWKALMGALSDLAAMGASPLGALIALCVPRGAGDGSLAFGVMEGVAEASSASGCPVVGGDVSAAGELVVAVSVLGEVGPGEPAAVSRAGARPGDAVLVTGPFGASAAALRSLREGVPDGAAYRRPVARLGEGTLARRQGAHAMIDVSDGLALDLHRLADASGVGFVLDSVPVAEGATLDEALGGGEDYELVFAVAPERVGPVTAAFEAGELRRPVCIGVCTSRSGERVLRGVPLERVGWQHRLG